MRNGLLIALTIVVGIIAAQDSWNVELVNEISFDEYGFTSDITVVDDCAYFHDTEKGLCVINVSNPVQPQYIASVDTGGSDLIISGDYAYTVSLSYFSVIDISDVTQPIQVFNWFLGNDIENTYLAVYENYLYIACDYLGLLEFDISNPAQPAPCDNFNYTAYVNCVEIFGNYAFLTDDDLTIVDLSDPINPEIIGSCVIEENSGSVALSGDYAYIGGNHALNIVNIENYSAPYVVDHIVFNTYVENSIVCGDTLFISNREDLLMYDISNPENPQLISSAETPGYIAGIDVVDDLVYIADGWSGIRIFDIENAEPEEIGVFKSSGNPYVVEIVDDYAYVGARGMYVYDISNPEQIAEIGYYDINYDTSDIAISGDYAYLLETWFEYASLAGEGIHIIDISDPTNPINVCYLNTEWEDLRSIAVSGDYMYVCNHFDGVMVFDVSDPENPVQINSYYIGVRTGCIAIYNNLLFVENYSGVGIVDISDPENLALIGQISSFGSIYEMVFNQNFAYFTYAENGVKIIDIGNPAQPELISTINIPNHTKGIHVDDMYIYVVSDEAGIFVYDVSDPAQPLETGHYDTSGNAVDIATSQDYAFVADFSAFGIYDCTAADMHEEDIPKTNTTLLGNAPNPFNPSTTIRYSLAVPGKVSLCIYNIRGKKVKTLYDGVQNAGEYSHVWDGMDDNGKAVASGVYLSRLESADQFVTGKMLLLK